MEIVLALLVERGAGFCFEAITEGQDLSQRLLEIVRSNLREILQLAIAPL
jgi:hypothetical protein